MVTRSQLGTVKPLERLSLHTSPISPIPKSPFLALKDPNWGNSMYDKYNALVKNGTWTLVPRLSNVNLVRSMWLFKHKFHANGTLSRYKARLVANGSSQQLNVDFDETFSLVVKPATIRTVLSLDVSRQWTIHQLDVKNAFLNDDLSETIYMHQPPGFVDPRYPHHVCLLQRSLYGLKQAPHVWFQHFANYATQDRFSYSRCDSLLFIYTQGSQKYALQLLERAHMVHCNTFRTPVDTETKLGLSYAVQQICLYMHDLREPHFAALKHVMHYVKGTLDLGLHLYASITTSLVGYTDADWAGFPSTCRSTSVVAETVWVSNLLHELHSPLMTTTLVYRDNVSVVYMSDNPVQHQQTKHIKIDIHFVRDMVKAGHVIVLHLDHQSEPGEMALESSKPVVIPKFNTHIFTSTLTLKELNQAIKEFCIPMDYALAFPLQI
ncbi:ribonuclease H-like domain-containing protein [Tanacetum coccineum]